LLLGEIRTAQISLDRQRKELADFDQAVERVIQSAEQLPKTRIEDLKFEISELLKNRRDLLKKLQAGYRRLFKKVQNLEFIDQEIATKAEDVADFLDGHLLWIRSAQGFGMRDLKNLPAALNWILNPSSWWQFLQDLGRSFGRNPVGRYGILLPSLSPGRENATNHITDPRPGQCQRACPSLVVCDSAPSGFKRCPAQVGSPA
jgi:potassium efflux system protein